MPGVMWSCLAGSRTLNGYSAISVAAMISPPGSRNSLSEVMPVRRLGSSDVPTPEVQPLSATVDGIVPSMIPRRSASSSLPMTYRRVAGGGSYAFAIFSCVLARIWLSCVLVRIWRDAWRFANRRAHRCAILCAYSWGTVGAISIVVLNFTVDLRVVLGSCSST